MPSGPLGVHLTPGGPSPSGAFLSERSNFTMALLELYSKTAPFAGSYGNQ